MSTENSADEQTNFIRRLRHAFSTYESASKKYLSAVKDLDNAMEGVAIAIRELAQGEVENEVRDRVDRLCSAIDAHKSTKESGGAAAPAGPPADGADPDTYFFSAYIADFAREITASINDLKTTTKMVEKDREARDKLVAKYNKLRADVDKLETKLARKNQGIANDEKYATKVEKRDALKTRAAEEEQRFAETYAALCHKKTETLNHMVSAFGAASSKYYTGIAQIMQSGA